MAGPVIASLGDFAFEAHGFGLTGINRELKTPWATHKVPGGLDRLQWMGGDSETVKIQGVLFPHVFGGLETLEGIRQAALAGTPLHLIQKLDATTGNVLSMFVVENVSDNQTFIAANGVAMRNAYTLSLRQFNGSFSERLIPFSGFF